MVLCKHWLNLDQNLPNTHNSRFKFMFSGQILGPTGEAWMNRVFKYPVSFFSSVSFEPIVPPITSKLNTPERPLSQNRFSSSSSCRFPKIHRRRFSNHCNHNFVVVPEISRRSNSGINAGKAESRNFPPIKMIGVWREHIYWVTTEL
jgi:hypothetical protein